MTTSQQVKDWQKKSESTVKIPILVGGYALQAEDVPKFEGKIIKDARLDEIPKILRIQH